MLGERAWRPLKAHGLAQAMKPVSRVKAVTQRQERTIQSVKIKTKHHHSSLCSSSLWNKERLGGERKKQCTHPKFLLRDEHYLVLPAPPHKAEREKAQRKKPRESL